ncbi:N-acetylmuramoyl-L-alanine amidase [Bacillus manliponensis]|uniref:N-acetylmuramoyl-L-alanine amidase n=1 Tax=Bacillus manliponensis TaxID=574376 RepID=UPI003512023C
MVKIWNDEGHGGYDPGAMGHGLSEKNITLEIGNRIYAILRTRASQVEVNRTRSSDVYVGLSERARRANNWGANFFASYHVDAGGGNRFTTYIHPSVPNQTRRIAEGIHKEVAVFFMKYGINDGGVRTADFAVLRETTMDACLFENGFIDHESHAKLLADEKFLDDLALVYACAYANVFDFTLALKLPLCRIYLGDFNSVEWVVETLETVKKLLPNYGVWIENLEGHSYRIAIGDFNSTAWVNGTFNKLKETFPNYGMWVEKL